MPERLKQIWGGFEGKTERRLTGRGIDNIAPPRREAADRAADPAPADMADAITDGPAAVAFAALKARLAAAESRAEKKRGRNKGRGPRADFAAAPPAPLSAAADDAGAPEAARDLIRGLKATEARLQRRDLDYTAVMAGEAGRALAGLRKRKKFLGIF